MGVLASKPIGCYISVWSRGLFCAKVFLFNAIQGCRWRIESEYATFPMGFGLAIIPAGRAALAAALATVTSLPNLDERPWYPKLRPAIVPLLKISIAHTTRRSPPRTDLMKRPEDAARRLSGSFPQVIATFTTSVSECSFLHVAVSHRDQRFASTTYDAARLARKIRLPKFIPTAWKEGPRDFFDYQKEHRPTLDPERSLIGQRNSVAHVRAMERLSPRERVRFRNEHYQGLKLRAMAMRSAQPKRR